MDVSFLHAADLHLDSPFIGLERGAPHVAELLRDASLRAFDRIVDHAMEHRVDFVVFAGDLYDGADRGLRAQLRFQRGLERLSSAGIDVFVVHGNHDPLEGWSAIRRWPERVTIFSSGDVRAVPVVRGGETVATVYGVSYQRREETENLAKRFSRGAAPGIHVGVLHCNLGSVGEYANYAPCTVADLAAARMDYWALGHIHLRQTLFERDMVVAYPGNTQGRSFKPSECGPKGVTLVRVSDGRIAPPTFLPTDSVRFLAVDVDVSGLEDLGTLRERLTCLCTELRGQHGQCCVALRARLLGACAFPEELARADAIPELLRELRSAEEVTPPFVWWADLRDESHAGIDLDSAQERGDLVGELAALRRELLDDSAAAEMLLRRAFHDCPPLRGRARGGDSAQSLIDAAARLLAARLLEEGGP